MTKRTSIKFYDFLISREALDIARSYLKAIKKVKNKLSNMEMEYLQRKQKIFQEKLHDLSYDIRYAHVNHDASEIYHYCDEFLKCFHKHVNNDRYEMKIRDIHKKHNVPVVSTNFSLN